MSARVTFVILLIAASFPMHAQELLAGPEWFDGSITLNNGRQINGLIKFSNKIDIVSIESVHMSKSYTARHLKGFEFFDAIENKLRRFLSIEIDDRIYHTKRPLFFEILTDVDDFALVSRLSPIRVDKREYATPAMFNPATGSFASGRYYGYPTTISHTETLFLLSKQGELRPILEITEKDVDGMFRDRKLRRNRIVDNEALQRFTGEHYKDLEQYARKNNIDLKTKSGIVQLLGQYARLKK